MDMAERTELEQGKAGSGVGSRMSGRLAELQASPEEINVGQAERAVSIAAGSILAGLGVARRSVPGAVAVGLGGALLYRGITGHSHVYDALGLDTSGRREDWQTRLTERGLHIEEVFLINKTPAELYAYWRDFSNLPLIMSHLKSVQILDQRRSHWIAHAPAGTVEWDAELTRDEPDTLIAWQSLPGSEVEQAGQIRFKPASGDRGTEVRVTLDYVPPAGRLGYWAATMFGQAPQELIRDDLRNFKRIMECGEILTTRGQPRGTCMGVGKVFKD